MWKVKAKVIPIVIGALGTVHKRLSGYLDALDLNTQIGQLQKSVLLGMASILRKVFEV